MSSEPLAGSAAAYAAAAVDDDDDDDDGKGEEEEPELSSSFSFSPSFFFSSSSSALSSISAARVNQGAFAQYSRVHQLSGRGHFILGRTMIAASTGRRTIVSPREMGPVATRPRRSFGFLEFFGVFFF